MSQQFVLGQTEALRSTFARHLARSLLALQARALMSGLLTAAEIERTYSLLGQALRPSAIELWPRTCAVMDVLAPLMDQAGQRSRWIEVLVLAIERSRQVEDRHVEAQLSVHLALQYQKVGELTVSATLLESSIGRFSALHDGRSHGWALSQLANLARLQGDLPTAVEHVDRAFELLDEGSLERHLGYSTLGAVALDRGEVEQAIVHFEESLITCNAYSETRLAAMRERSLGWAYCLQQEFDRAKEYLASSIATFQLLADESELALSYVNLGFVWSRSGQPEKALDLYAEAQPILQKMRDYANLAILHNNKGMEYMVLEQWGFAEDSFLLGAGFHRQLNNVYYLCSTLSNLADVYLRSKQKDKAICVLQEALALMESGEIESHFVEEQSKIEEKLASAFSL